MCIGNAWGATKYYATGRVIAVRFGGDDENFGQVGVLAKTSTTYDVSKIDWGTDKTDYTTAVTYPASSTSNVNILCFAQEIENSGYIFKGWFTNPLCTDSATTYLTSGTTDWSKTSKTYCYRPVTRGNIPQSTNTSKETAVVYGPIYAKFEKPSAPTYNYSAQVAVTSSNYEWGQIDASLNAPFTDLPSYSNLKQAPMSLEKTVDGSEEESISRSFYIGARSVRGYQFKKWTVTPGSNVTIDNEYSQIAVATVTLDKDMKTIKGGRIYNPDSVVTAVFEEAPAYTFWIQKEFAVGKVAGSYRNIYKHMVNDNNQPIMRHRKLHIGIVI